MINSMVVRKPLPNHSDYATAKAALRGLANSLAIELGPYKIRVNSLYMGWMWGEPVQAYIDFEMGQQDISQEEAVAQVAKSIPLGRIPTDEECAKAALFLVSDYASAMTGASLDVNGGEFMSA